MRRCLLPTCREARRQGDAFCIEHWNSVPQAMRNAFWDTRPHSNERRGELLKIVRWLIDGEKGIA